MKTTLIIFFLVVAVCDATIAQNPYLFEFPGIQKAIKNGTRTRSGEPGPAYWQNSSDYKLEVSLDTAKNILYGKGLINYHNNSPSALSTIIIRLYQDLFKKGTVRNLEISPDNLHEGTYLVSLSINGINYLSENKPVDVYRVDRTFTTLTIYLSDSIPSGGTGLIELAWNFPIPSADYSQRMGYCAENYFISLWYPQVAVYDDYKGWDDSPHLGMQEFYNDFNNYDVTINVPEGYMVWATGECENLPDVLDKSIVERLDFARNHDSIVSILSSEDYKRQPIIGNSWHFKAEHVPDFAFAAATNYSWKGSSLIVDHESGRRVFIDIAYPEDSLESMNAIKAAKNAVRWGSEVYPGIPFPYSHATAYFNYESCGGGMEFPMIAYDVCSPRSDFISFLVEHELLHNYMPFYMGFNETGYGWMDEGWTSFLGAKLNGDSSFMNMMIYTSYQSYAGTLSDQPLIYSTMEANGFDYSNHAYVEHTFYLLLLEELLGQEIFSNATRDFMLIWNGKHPTPYDFFYSFNRSARENLDWFWRACYFDFGYVDLGIKIVKKDKIIIENIGNIPVPVKLEITFDDNSVEKIYENPRIWNNKLTEYPIKLKTRKTIRKITLGDDKIPDYDLTNNVYQK